MPENDRALQFAAGDDGPIPYIERTRDYYLAQGYPKPYNWAQLAEVPFTQLSKPLGQANLAVITTAAPIRLGLGEQGPGAPLNLAAALEETYAAPCGDVPELGISHLAYDRDHASRADPRSFFALPALAEAVATGRVGSLAPRFHGVPNRYSQRAVIEDDAPEILARLQEDTTDAAVLAAI